MSQDVTTATPVFRAHDHDDGHRITIAVREWERMKVREGALVFLAEMVCSSGENDVRELKRLAGLALRKTPKYPETP